MAGFGRQAGSRRRSLAAAGLAVVLAGCGATEAERHPMAGASAAEGRRVIARVGCASCHDIPGVDWPRGRTGPSLNGFADRPLIAGRLPNEPDLLAAYVRDATRFTPRSGMPPMPLTDTEARDVAAYLYTLKPE
ncbi:MAG: c-type cytochrome [Brevundimonas sp.]